MKPSMLAVFSIVFISAIQAEITFEKGELESIKNKMRGLIKDTFEDIVSDPVFGHQLLKDRFYFFTKPLKTRDILDRLLLNDTEHTEPFTLFYQQTSKAFYTENESSIQSYVDMKEKGLIEALDRFEFLTIEVPKVLSLFEHLKVQERRIGAVLQYRKMFEKWRMTFRLPIVYQEYNFYLDANERKALQNVQLFKPRITQDSTIEDGPKKKPEGKGFAAFVRQHLLSDKLGFSDVHLTFETVLKRWKASQVFIGCTIKIPTEFALKNGVIGAYFDKQYPEPQLDLHADIVDLYGEGQHDQLKQNVLDFGVATLDRLATILLEQPLGNSRHPALCPLGELLLEFKKFSVNLRGSFEVQIPVAERRFFKRIPDQAALDAAAVSEPETEEESREQVAFLSRQLVQKLFPKSYRTVVFPGVVIQGQCMLRSKGAVWSLVCGAQWWCQAAERFLCLDAPADQKRWLDIPAARQGAAMQITALFGVSRTSERSFCECTFSGTPLSYAIGRSFAFTFSFTRLF